MKQSPLKPTEKVPPLTKWSYFPKKWVNTQIKKKNFKGILVPGKNKEIFGFLGMIIRTDQGTLVWFPNVVSEEAVKSLTSQIERKK